MVGNTRHLSTISVNDEEGSQDIIGLHGLGGRMGHGDQHTIFSHNKTELVRWVHVSECPN